VVALALGLTLLMGLSTAPADASSPSWTAGYLPQPPNSGGGHRTFGVSCLEPSDCIAVGENWSLDVHTNVTLAERWDGELWTPMDTPNPPGLSEGWKYDRHAVLRGVSCTSASSCVAVGWYRGSDDVPSPLVEHWDGSEWSTAPVPTPLGTANAALEDVSCTSPTDCVAVGRFEDSEGVDRTLAERWDGSEWTPELTPDPAAAPASWLSGVSCPSVTACIAVGGYETEGGTEKTLAERLISGEWKLQKPQNPGSRATARLDGVSCSSETACTAVGYFQNGPTIATLAERWDGNAWTTQPTPTPNGEGNLYGVSCALPTSCTAAGTYYSTSESDHGWRTLLERWNGAEWNVLEPAKLPVPAGWWHEAPLDSVSCPQADACVAVGSALGAPEGSGSSYRAFAEHEIVAPTPPDDPDPTGSADPDPQAPGAPGAPPPSPIQFTFGDPMVRCDGRIVITLVALGPGTFAADAAIGAPPRTGRKHGGEAGSNGCVTRVPGPFPKAGSPNSGRADKGQRIGYGSASASTADGRPVRVTISPRSGVLASFLRSARLRMEISIAFNPTGGTPSTQRRLLVLERKRPRLDSNQRPSD